MAVVEKHCVKASEEAKSDVSTIHVSHVGYIPGPELGLVAA